MDATSEGLRAGLKDEFGRRGILDADTTVIVAAVGHIASALSLRKVDISRMRQVNLVA